MLKKNLFLVWLIPVFITLKGSTFYHDINLIDFDLASKDQLSLESSEKLTVKGTRSWIRLNWTEHFTTSNEVKIFWSAYDEKPETPQAIIPNDIFIYYIKGVEPEVLYHVWVESKNVEGDHTFYYKTVFTKKEWVLEPGSELNLHPQSSSAVPEGMFLYWHDEFHDLHINRNKWSTNYYSTIDFRNRTLWDRFRSDNLPQPAMIFNGETMTLITSDEKPEEPFWSSGRKVSSIQTYDWNADEFLLDTRGGGYFEVRVRRDATEDARIVNTAFWFDAPGPDMRYYLEEGNTAMGATGIRPPGQPFEIDIFEYMTGEIVLHGKVNEEGRFMGNIGHYIIEDVEFIDQWVTHGMLWTPSSLKFYVNGELKTEWSDPHDIKSPNYPMNVFLGTYGLNGTVEMEVDYIRYYRWKLEGNNELPNGDFSYSTTAKYPWSGTASLSKNEKRSGEHGVILKPNEYLEQYVYLDHSQNYQLNYWKQGGPDLFVKIENIKQVKGYAESTYSFVDQASNPYFQQGTLDFTTDPELKNHMRTIRLFFKNNGDESIILDDIEIKKGGSGGSPVDAL